MVNSMDKVLITLIVPSLGEQYDVFLPKFLTIGESISLLAKALTEITGNRYVTSGNEFLCSSERQIVFNQTCTIKECGIQNSDVLLLF